jgi:hypothetical protein
MRTSGSESDALLAIIPAVVMTILVVMMLGGPDETMHTLDRFLKAVVNGAGDWVNAARRR